MKSFLLAALLALGLASGSASAAPDPFKTVSDLDNGTPKLQTVVGAGSFSHFFGIDLGESSDFYAGAQKVSVSRKNGDISNLGLSLFDGSGTQVSGLNTFAEPGLFELSGLLGAGRYFLNVTGLLSAPKGVTNATGSYVVAFDAVAAPVPEPGAWVLMLAGVGAVGMMISRRRHASGFAIAA